ncbi:MAG TPA: BlaI/MecI/CopY family transcriptional regulator [Pirellulales bacterium]|jgi:predicted transcriptional regulator|nr:BlaI/MecI/CopY family transcriptional regulator [Pirellulales bacterium]
MARPKSTQPTDGELELLKLLWEAGPCELGQLCAELRRQRPVATTTVATMLKVMLGKGLIKRTRTSRGYLWSAKVSRAATTRKLVEKLLDRAFDGSAQLLVAHLVESRTLSKNDREQILALLEVGSSARPLDAPRSNE